MRNRDLSRLGDSVANLLYSLYLSIKIGKITGGRLGNDVLSRSLDRTGLRKYAGRRLSRREKANAAEALIGYAFLSGISIGEMLSVMLEETEIDDSISRLLRYLFDKLFPSPESLP